MKFESGKFDQHPYVQEVRESIKNNIEERFNELRLELNLPSNRTPEELANLPGEKIKTHKETGGSGYSYETFDPDQKLDYNNFTIIRREANEPKFDEEGNIVVMSINDRTDGYLPRYTTHFTLNGEVGSHDSGDWTETSTVYMAPLQKFVAKNGRPENVASYDTFYVGSTVLPEGATIFTSDKDFAEKIDKEKYEVVFLSDFEEHSDKEKYISDMVREKVESLNNTPLSVSTNNTVAEHVDKLVTDFGIREKIPSFPHRDHWAKKVEELLIGQNKRDMGVFSEKLRSLVINRTRMVENPPSWFREGYEEIYIKATTIPPFIFRNLLHDEITDLKKEKLESSELYLEKIKDFVRHLSSVYENLSSRERSDIKQVINDSELGEDVNELTKLF